MDVLLVAGFAPLLILILIAACAGRAVGFRRAVTMVAILLIAAAGMIAGAIYGLLLWQHPIGLPSVDAGALVVIGSVSAVAMVTGAVVTWKRADLSRK
jgi:hypothetical protein